jgi:tRNA-uridine 2-sulfurtransferase
MKSMELNITKDQLPPIGSKVYVGLSGGVDSSVTAYLLKSLGYDVLGIFLICWDPRSPGCTAEKDQADAVKVAASLKIPIKILNFEKEYKETVFREVINEYSKGRIPNPDVWCNTKIKFGLLMDYVLKEDPNAYLATGHYARIGYSSELSNYIKRDMHRDTPLVKLALDKAKDQSYFLYQISSSRLKNVIFPLGGVQKDQVREYAKSRNIYNWDKPDSQGICFIGDSSITDLIKSHLVYTPGYIVNPDGKKIGRHEGLNFYTIGQRQGIHLDIYSSSPKYVISKDFDKNRLIVGERKDAYKSIFYVKKIFNHLGVDLAGLMDIKVRIRNLGGFPDVKLSYVVDKYKFSLSDPLFGINPGQHAVLYLNSNIIGGGVIELI